MAATPKTWRLLKKAGDGVIKSKVKFTGYYKEELKTTMEAVEARLDEEFANDDTILSILPGNTNLKIRVRNDDDGVDGIINCVYWYKHNDIKFGYLHIDLVTTSHSETPKTKYMGKFNVMDREDIKERILEEVIETIKTL